MDALDLDHSYCARCETYIWPEKRQVEVQVAAKAAPAPPAGLKSKSGTIKARRPTEDTITKIRTVISLDKAPLYCSEKCRQLDQESGSANGRRIMEHFQPSPTSCLPSPISPSCDRPQHNMDYFTRIAGRPLPWTRRPSTTSTRSTTSMSSLELLEEHRQWSRALLAESAERLSHSDSRAAISAESTTLPKPKSKSKPAPPKREQDESPAPVPFTHRRWKEGSNEMRSGSRTIDVDVDVAALYDQYPMSQRVRSASSFGSGCSMRRGSMTGSTTSDTASIRTTSSRGSTRRQGALSADATRGLLVPAVMIREDGDSARSVHSDDSEPEHFYRMRRNRTITQRNHSYSKSTSDAPRSPRPRDDKTIQELVREAGGPEYHTRQGSRPVSCALNDFDHSGPLYQVIRTPPGPVKRHAVHEVQVDGKRELRIVEQTCWETEEPQKLFHFMV